MVYCFLLLRNNYIIFYILLIYKDYLIFKIKRDKKIDKNKA